MSGRVHFKCQIDGQIEQKDFGPWRHEQLTLENQFVGAELLIPAGVKIQVLGGVAPQIAAITVAKLLYISEISAASALQLGVNGADAQAQGVPIDDLVIYSPCSLTNIQLYNGSGIDVKAFVVLAGNV